ncbi:DUF4382 domain-containing protein [Pedobacter frigiditerrae]|uniref:DUF4382 domain-containing protein n=1 Tax=Pedobacter frigiditerrae TaxID=2530452 RepID=A0A4R0MLN6_9SPHI|nr:DUF4382 domain-containing protein [Pedobacter frigiditerrae]TCC87337.1 DUF4382 domain-containing protein [Pedobacter frigiditerrae]
MKNRILTYSSALLVTLLAIFIGCKKDSDNASGTTKIQVRMTDAPGDFDKINLNVKEIILISDEKSYVLASTATTFNILDFRIGTSNPDILVATGDMPSGEITEVRLVLNDGNTIVEKGVVKPLKTPSGQSSGYKVKLTSNPTLVPGVTYSLVLDFDAAKSIVKLGNGDYLLKPVVRGITAVTSGLISGTVLPLAARPEILVIKGTDTVGTLADPISGKFTVGGLAAGSYAVKFVPLAGYRDSTINNVNVSLGQNTSIGTITLK